MNLREHHLEAAGRVAPGRVIFRVHNRGQLTHELILAALPRDLPPLDIQLHSAVRRPLAAIALMPPHPPGGDGSFAADLAPGRYGLFSFVQGPDGVPDALRGMNAELLAG